MIETFDRLHGLRHDALKPEELARARELAANKFHKHEWTAEVP